MNTFSQFTSSPPLSLPLFLFSSLSLCCYLLFPSLLRVTFKCIKIVWSSNDGG